MANPNKRLKRPDGLGRLYKYKNVTDDEGNEKILTLPIEKTLEDNYVYLFRAMKKDDYQLVPEDSCFFFKEIVADNEVVGFSTYRPSNIDNNSLIMQYFYVLEDFRNRGLLEEELDEAISLFESSILVEYPSRDMVESLIHHKLARVFDDRFVISKIPFVVPIVPVAKAIDGVFREAYPFGEKVYRKLSLIYDLELCAVVGLASDDAENNFEEDIDIEDPETDMNNYNVISLPLRIDDDKYGCVEKRKNDSDIISDTYFKKVRKLVDDNDEVIENWLSIQ